jgi:TolB protein
MDLHVLDVRSREVVRVVAAPGDEFYRAWSPDGREIAFARQLTDSVDILTVRIAEAGTDPMITALGIGVWPRWSPDGRRLAFFSRRDTDGEQDEVYVLDRSSGDVARLTNRPGHDFCPSSSPTGDRLVVVSIDLDGSQSLRIPNEKGEEEARGVAIIASRNPRGRRTGARWHTQRVRREGEPHQLFLERIAPMVAR